VSTVWVVLVEDCHDDVEAVPFSTKAGAVAAAREAVNGRGDVCDEELSRSMRADGCVLLLSYGESDCVRVVERNLDDAGKLR
jgi:glucose-6-phosphate dehydrogenase assembly protein OpcA